MAKSTEKLSKLRSLGFRSGVEDVINVILGSECLLNISRCAPRMFIHIHTMPSNPILSSKALQAQDFMVQGCVAGCLRLRLLIRILADNTA